MRSGHGGGPSLKVHSTLCFHATARPWTVDRWTSAPSQPPIAPQISAPAPALRSARRVGPWPTTTTRPLAHHHPSPDCRPTLRPVRPNRLHTPTCHRSDHLSSVLRPKRQPLHKSVAMKAPQPAHVSTRPDRTIAPLPVWPEYTEHLFASDAPPLRTSHLLTEWRGLTPLPSHLIAQTCNFARSSPEQCRRIPAHTCVQARTVMARLRPEPHYLSNLSSDLIAQLGQ